MKKSLGILGGALLLVAAVFLPGAQEPGAATLQAGVQLSDDRCGAPGAGPSQAALAGGGWSGWAMDSNGFDPDCARINFVNFTEGTDFRLGLQANDEGSCRSSGTAQIGNTRFTPWASEGGGWSGWVTDNNAFDPDCVRIAVETRKMPAGTSVVDARVAVKLADYACTAQIGSSRFTPWASEGGGWSGWAGDQNGFDSDCYSLELEVRKERLGNVSVLIETTDGTRLPASWTLRGPDGASKASGEYSRLYEGVPFGAYTLEELPATLVAPDGRTFKRISTTPSASQNLGPVSPASCPAGESNPHLGCKNNACVKISGCGPSTCPSCGGGSGPGGGPNQQKDSTFRRIFDAFFEHAFAAYLCDSANRGCYQTEGPGGDQCDSNADCGGSTEPPAPPSPPSPPPPPTAISFTVTYEPVPGPGDPPEGLPVQCSPETKTITSGSSVEFSAEGGTGVFNWSAPEGSPTSTTGKTFTTAFATKKPSVTRQVVVTSGTKTATCQVTVIGSPICDDPRRIGVTANIPATWTITGPVSYTQTEPVFSKEYAGVPEGAYTIVPGSVPGYVVSVSPASTQTLSQCGGRVFTLTYTEDPQYKDVACTPVAQPSSGEEIPRNKKISVSARGGTQAYSWSATGGSPASGSGTSFMTSYAEAGKKKIYVTDGKSTASCSVTVADCPGAPSLVIAPPSATTTIGQAVQFEALYDKDGPTCGEFRADDVNVTADAAWKVERAAVATPARPGEVRGATPGVTGVTATYERLTANAILNVTGQNDFGCVAVPDRITLLQGETKEGLVRCSPLGSFAGSIDLSASNLPAAASMSFDPPSVPLPPSPADATYSFTAGAATLPGNYTVRVTGKSGEIVHMIPVYVEVQPAEAALSVALSASPASGSAPLMTTLTAEVSGSVTGAMTYSLWWNCAYTGTSTAEAANRCGPPASGSGNGNGIVLANQAQAVRSVTHTYSATGSYRPFVIVERGGAAASARTGVSATTGTGTETHTECIASACVRVEGAGVNRCGVSADCGGGGGQFHGECSAEEQACVNVAGAGPSTCTSDPACSGAGPTHLECQNNACVIASGVGGNTGGCAAVGQSCTGGDTPDPNATCTLAANPRIIRKGDASKLSWTCQSPVTACSITGTSIYGGKSGSGSVNPTKTQQYTLSCNSGAYTAQATVYVVQSFDEVPPGSR